MMAHEAQSNAASKPMKYVFVSGGVLSGVGKGILASSTGVLLKSLGMRPTAIKIDPYLNIDAGTLSPLDHGEVFILEDGGEVDLDLGNYERFLDIELTRDNNITTGKIYQQVIERERKGDYLGKTVQVVPHVTDAIQNWIERVAVIPVDKESKDRPDVCIVELGGTVGDIESAPFVEAVRQFQQRVGPENFLLIHVSLVPVVGSVGEQKTKPTQNSVRDLRGLGLSPHLIACRSNTPLEQSTKDKIAMFCMIPPKAVLGVHDCASVYHVPQLLAEGGMREYLASHFGIDGGSDDVFWSQWCSHADSLVNSQESVKIAIVGKYTFLKDSYISIIKALNHAAMSCKLQVDLQWIEATDLEPASPKQEQSIKTLQQVDGVLVPGGFGSRGTEGKLLACQWAREAKIPFLGICLGMQLAVIEHARNVLGWQGAHSLEIDPDTPHPIIINMPEISKTHLGGTMRLGGRPTHFCGAGSASKLYSLYHEFGCTLGDAKNVIEERHRHRYEVNPALISQLEGNGMSFLGKDSTGQRMEIVERSDHPFFVATQYHPEFKSRPLHPSPPFIGLVRAAVAGKRNGSVMMEQSGGIK